MYFSVCFACTKNATATDPHLSSFFFKKIKIVSRGGSATCSMEESKSLTVCAIIIENDPNWWLFAPREGAADFTALNLEGNWLDRMRTEQTEDGESLFRCQAGRDCIPRDAIIAKNVKVTSYGKYWKLSEEDEALINNSMKLFIEAEQARRHARGKPQCAKNFVVRHREESQEAFQVVDVDSHQGYSFVGKCRMACKDYFVFCPCTVLTETPDEQDTPIEIAGLVRFEGDADAFVAVVSSSLPACVQCYFLELGAIAPQEVPPQTPPQAPSVAPSVPTTSKGTENVPPIAGSRVANEDGGVFLSNTPYFTISKAFFSKIVRSSHRTGIKRTR